MCRYEGARKGAPYEARWYTREAESPLIRGYQEVEPFIDSESGKPMRTMFGDANRMPIEGIKVDPRWEKPTEGTKFNLKPQVGDRATELVGKTAAKLAGIKGVNSSNDLKVENFRNLRDTDLAAFNKFKQRLLGVDLKSAAGPLDVELRDVGKARGIANIQVEAWTDGRGEGFKKAVQKQIPKVGLKQAAGAAGYASQPGKLKKGYDLVQLDYESDYAKRNQKNAKGEYLPKHQQDKITEPPVAVKYIDNNQLNDEIDRLGTKLNPNDVRPGQGGKVIWEAPEGTKGIKDISGTGNVPQILKNLDYVQSPEAPTPITSIARTVKNVAKNPVVRMAGVALGAVPVLGDAADAATGTYDAVTKKGDAQVRGAGNAAAGVTGLTALAAPAAAPLLAPISAGIGAGNLLADVTLERRNNDKTLTSNSDKAENAGAFISTPEAPVTIQGPSAQPIVSETQRRRNARRSTGGAIARPTTAGGWWNQALGSLGLQ